MDRLPGPVLDMQTVHRSSQPYRAIGGDGGVDEQRRLNVPKPEFGHGKQIIQQGGRVGKIVLTQVNPLFA
ncbi:hypothetical protein D3C76_1290650 [compost metagenome]